MPPCLAKSWQGSRTTSLKPAGSLQTGCSTICHLLPTAVSHFSGVNRSTWHADTCGDSLATCNPQSDSAAGAGAGAGVSSSCQAEHQKGGPLLRNWGTRVPILGCTSDPCCMLSTCRQSSRGRARQQQQLPGTCTSRAGQTSCQRATVHRLTRQQLQQRLRWTPLATSLRGWRVQAAIWSLSWPNWSKKRR